jgi:hypothetical protein
MFLKRFTALLGAPVLLLGVACQSTTTDQQPNQKLAAYAASVSFPGNTHAEDSTNVGAVVDPSSKILRIYNFGPNELDGSEVWVNGSFVYKVDSLPGNGVVKLNLADFYDHDGHSFADTNATVTTVQLHAGDHVWKLLGPINQ